MQSHIVAELPRSVKRASKILSHRNSLLRDLYARCEELLQLQAIVRKAVPGDIFVASCTDGTLHLITPSSALATRLRYTRRNLVSSLRQAGIREIDNIRISVRPDFEPYSQPERKSAIPPSRENARHIESTAKYIEDEPLRKALIRLSRQSTDP